MNNTDKKLKLVIGTKKRLSGILNGGNPLDGPRIVQLDITNRCNSRCLACWSYSPFLSGSKDERWQNQELSFDRLKEIIEELSLMECEIVILAGGGEPLLYPRLIELIEKIREKNMACIIVTNGTLLNKSILHKLMKLKVHKIFLSLWAADAKIYGETHPDFSKDVFYKIKNNILYLKKIKQEAGVYRPDLGITNVIFNKNFQEISKMFEFALEIDADSVHFSLMKIVSKELNLLNLTPKEEKILLKELQGIRDGVKKLNKEDHLPNLSPEKLPDSIDEIIWQLSEKNKIPLKNYALYSIDKIPCYMGWMMSKILANGDVIPCCSDFSCTMGNIYEHKFNEIWNSREYNNFRHRVKEGKEKNSYFENSGCLQYCNHKAENIIIYNFIKEYSAIFKEYKKS